MAGNTFGNYFKVTTWGESHGPAIGAVVDGCPAGIELTEDDFKSAMKRRLPDNPFITTRKEPDKVHILSGVYNGVTLGTPISLVIYNEAAESKAYEDLAHIYRPGHADYTYDAKYQIRDTRGGGRASGRETAARVMAGCIAGKIIKLNNIDVCADVVSVGGMPVEKAYEVLKSASIDGDSLGGITECTITGLMPGLGEPVFDKLDAMLAHAMLSIPGAKGFEIGKGFEIADFRGSEVNDEFYSKDGNIHKLSNNSGGVLGGISDGDKVCFKVAFKPTPSIALEQKTVTDCFENTTITIKGKHDTCYCLRTPVIVEAMTNLVLADLILANRLSRFSS